MLVLQAAWSLVADESGPAAGLVVDPAPGQQQAVEGVVVECDCDGSRLCSAHEWHFTRQVRLDWKR